MVGGLGVDIGAMYYWAPEGLAWESLEIGYTDFLQWAVSDRLAQFYEVFRWDGWQDDVANISPDQVFSFYPPLWTADASVLRSERKAIAIEEHYAFSRDVASQL